MIKFDFDENCYGCTICSSICPKDAISIYENNEGFLQPKVDMNKCIDCGLCDNVCIHENPVKSNTKLQESKFFKMNLKDEESLSKSTSGGAFYALAKYFIDNGAYVCGCAWNKQMSAEHIIVNSYEELEKLRGSKYVQSNIEPCLSEIKELIKNEKVVFFSGTPCQIEAVKRIVGNSNLLYTCALFCEGVASPKALRLYIDELEKNNKSTIIDIKMRKNKPYGWNAPRSEYIFSNGKKVKKLSFINDEYIESFIQGLLMRNSCYNCNYKASNIEADFIIGDYWGADKKDINENKNLGISSLIIRNEKAYEIILKLQYIKLEEIDYDRSIKNNHNLIKPMKKNKKRDEFFSKIDNLPFSININQFINYKSSKMKLIVILDKTRLYKVLRFFRNRRYN